MNIFPIGFIFALGACGISASQIERLQQENLRLKEEMEKLKLEIPPVQNQPENSPVVLANTELREIVSSINGQRYSIKVKFPRGYFESSQNYPVLYVTDAETNFGGVSYIVQRLIKDKLIPPILLIGIAYETDYKNFYRLRSRDLSPVEVPELRLGGQSIPDPTGGADAFADFLEEELFPFIAREYRVVQDDKSLYGHSYGGLFGSHILLNRPELFQRYLLLSPSLWFNDTMLLKQIDTVQTKFVNTRLYMASGSDEGRIDDMQIEFIAKLKGRNWTGITYLSEILDQETHRTVFGRGFTNGLRYLFKE